MAVAAVQNVRRDFVDVAKHFRRDAIFADVNEILAFFFSQIVSVSVYPIRIRVRIRSRIRVFIYRSRASRGGISRTTCSRVGKKASRPAKPLRRRIGRAGATRDRRTGTRPRRAQPVGRRAALNRNGFPARGTVRAAPFFMTEKKRGCAVSGAPKVQKRKRRKRVSS